MSIKRSNRPFRGAYNRSYVDENGEYNRLYTNESSFGTNSGLNFTHVVLLTMIAIFIILLLSVLYESIVTGQVDGELIIVISTFIAILLFCVRFIIYDIKRYREAYNYFKKHPDKLTTNKMVVEDICPRCGTQNNDDSPNCTNCGQSLKLYRNIDTDEQGDII